ncbi:MAG: hypothetical protein ACK5O2_06405 [Microthrixaceae bacterium]
MAFVRIPVTSRHALACATAFTLLFFTACGEDQIPWCSDLEKWSGLDALAAAITAGDSAAASDELEGFDEMARSAPQEIRSDMETVSSALAASVGVALDDGATDPDKLELRRDELNVQLGRITTQLQAVSTFAETECGIRLDP